MQHGVTVEQPDFPTRHGGDRDRRTTALGGHVERCENCGDMRPASLQLLPQPVLPEVPGSARAEWLVDRQGHV